MVLIDLTYSAHRQVIAGDSLESRMLGALPNSWNVVLSSKAHLLVVLRHRFKQRAANKKSYGIRR